MREYLVPVVKVDQFLQYVDDSWIAATNATDFTPNSLAVFKYIRPTGLKLPTENAILDSDRLNSSAEPFHQK